MKKTLKLAAPVSIGLESFSGIVPQFDLCRKLVNELVPFRKPGLLQTAPVIVVTVFRNMRPRPDATMLVVPIFWERFEVVCPEEIPP